MINKNFVILFLNIIVSIYTKQWYQHYYKQKKINNFFIWANPDKQIAGIIVIIIILQIVV